MTLSLVDAVDDTQHGEQESATEYGFNDDVSGVDVSGLGIHFDDVLEATRKRGYHSIRQIRTLHSRHEIEVEPHAWGVTAHCSPPSAHGMHHRHHRLGIEQSNQLKHLEKHLVGERFRQVTPTAHRRIDQCVEHPLIEMIGEESVAREGRRCSRRRRCRNSSTASRRHLITNTRWGRTLLKRRLKARCERA